MRLTAARASLAIVAMMVTLSSCDAQGCIPTVTRAYTARLVNAKSPTNSSVLAARLTAHREPLKGLTIAFSIKGHDLGSAKTNSKGLAELDLKGAPLELVRTATSKDYLATYASYGGKYCSSGDDAPIQLVAA